MIRRNFIEMGSLLAASTQPGLALYKNTNSKAPDLESNDIDFMYDGKILSPSDYSQLIMKLADEGKINPTINRDTPESIADGFIKALSESD